MSVAGTLELQMLMDMARLKQDTDKAKSMVGDMATQMRGALDGVRSVMGALGVGLSIAGLAAFVKQGIDAADAANELSQKTGLATKDVAGLQLAFKQGGVASEAMGTSLAKMAKQMAEGNAAFDTLGVRTKNADGSLRGVKDVLYDTADAFSGIKDGAGKTALSMELFGKSGADMIPVLNGGSAGLREMAEMAGKLGLEIDQNTAQAADQFNDQIELLGMGTKGIATQLAAQLLPTLTSLSASFLESMTSGDALAKVADGLAITLKGVYSAGVIGVEVFSTFGKVIAGVAGAVLSVAQGEFRQAQRMLEESGRDIIKGWKGTADTVARAWTDSGNKTVTALAGMGKAQRDAAAQTKAHGQASDKAAADALKLAKASAEVEQKIGSELAVLNRRLSLGRDLTDAEKDYQKILDDVRAGKLKYTDAELRGIEAKLQARDALRAQIQAEGELLKAQAAVAAHSSKLADAEAARTAKMREDVVTLREQNATLGLNDRALAERTARLYEDEAATIEWNAANQGGNVQLEEQARLLRERAALTRDGVVLKEAQAARDEWAKTTESIGQGLTDSLYRAFESGRDFFSTLWQGIKNTFKTTILKVAVQAVMNPVNAVLGSVLGGASGLAQAGTGGVLGEAGGLGNILNLGGIAGTLGTLGSFGATGLMSTLTGTSLGTSLGAAGSLISGGSVAGGIGMGLGAVAPYLLAAFAVASLFKDKSAKLGFGSASLGAGGITDAERLMGWGRGTETGRQDQLQSIAGALLGQVGAQAAAFGGSASGLSLQAATDIDRKGGGDAMLAFFRGGAQAGLLATNKEVGGPGRMPADQLATWFTDRTSAAIIAGLQASDLPERFRQYFAAFDVVGLTKAKADEILATATGVKNLTDALSPLGGVFGRLGSLSVQATAEMASLVGGLDQFVSKAQAYVGAFYSAEEQAALSASQIDAALKAAGIDTASLTDKAAYRSAVDATDLTSEAGRQQLAALLDSAAQFAAIVDQLGGSTLADLAARAPGGALAEALSAAPDAGSTLVSDSVMTIGDRITGGVTALQASTEAGFSGLAGLMQRVATQLERWDDGGAMVTTPAT